MTTELFEVGDECHGEIFNLCPVFPFCSVYHKSFCSPWTGGNPGQNVQPACGAACKTLSTKDYIDLLWTTLAEFPGLSQPFSTLLILCSSSLIPQLNSLPGLVITFLIIERLGRRWTMAIEFFVFSFFVYLVNMCTTRYVHCAISLLSIEQIHSTLPSPSAYIPMFQWLIRICLLFQISVDHLPLHRKNFHLWSISGCLCLHPWGAYALILKSHLDLTLLPSIHP